jgi:regulatory protein
MGNFAEAFSFAASLCSASEQCAQDILRKTMRFELSEEEKSRLVKQLEKEGFLNKQRYVHAFVTDRFQFSKWGKFKIRHLLKQKGFDESTIDEGIESIDDEQYTETLLTLLKQKRTGLSHRNLYELKGKLYRFALGRGFEPAMISTCLKRMDLDACENDDFPE